MKIVLEEGAMVSRAHPLDAGLDLYARKDVWIRPLDREFIDTGVHVEIPPNTVGFIKSRSGLLKMGVTTDGTIDCGYTGSIGVFLYNHSKGDIFIKKGDRIAQMVIVPCLLPELELVDKLEETDRGDNGFGSTGR